MAQLVVAAAGAALGGFIAPGIVAFGMTGASLGWMAGSMIGSAFAPTQKSSGPQLSDLSVSTSAYGTPIPYVQGHPRIAGQIVWASTKREIATTTEQGKGGGGAEYTTYTYEVDLLILLTDNEIDGVPRIWKNGELVYSILTDANPATIDASISNGGWSRLTVYSGVATQLPDPDYESSVGVANAPAYRGRGSIFIKSLQLGNSGQIPNLTFEVATNGVGSTYGWELDRTGNQTFSASGTFISTPFEPHSGNGCMDSSGGVGAGGFGSTQPLGVWDFGVSSFSMKMWVKPRAFSLAALFFVRYDTTFPSIYVYAQSDGTVQFNFSGLGQASAYAVSFRSIGKLVLNQWNEVEFSRSGNIFSGYINDVFEGSGSSTLAVKTETAIRSIGIGAGLAPAPFNGYIDDVTFHVGANLILDVPFNTLGLFSPENLTIQSVVNNLLNRTGLGNNQYSTTALASITRPVRSMAVSSVSSARTVLDMLAASYHFDAVLSDKIYFRPRASAPAATLTFNELGVVVDSGSTPDPLPLTQANELEIPAQMALTYSNVDGDYQTDTQYSDRLLTGQESTSAMQVPLGFTSSEAKQIVDAMLIDKAVSALATSVRLGVTRAALEPTDVVLLTGEDGSTYRMRIAKKSEASGVTTLECVQDDSTVFTQTGTTSGGTASQTTVLATPTTTLALLDVPLLRDVDNLPGHYVAVKGSAANWTSAGLYDSLDDLTYTPNTTISSQAVMGTCTTTLPTWAGGNVFDEASSITVNVGTQQLASVTRDDILASQSTNAALIGSEVLQYRTATLVSAGVYTLSGFLRGQRGTASTGHSVSERFILLASGGLRFVPLQQGDLGRLRYYKAASAGQRLSAVTSQSLTPAGITLKPFAPVDARANRDTADTVLTWIRQTRLSTRIVGTLGISSPLGETAEAYEVEIYTAGHAALLRTLTSATPSVTYTSAQQVTDFGAGQSAIAVKIYQISATVGRGTPLTTTV